MRAPPPAADQTPSVAAAKLVASQRKRSRCPFSVTRTIPRLSRSGRFGAHDAPQRRARAVRMLSGETIIARLALMDYVSPMQL
jgi:hypothetical protein